MFLALPLSCCGENATQSVGRGNRVIHCRCSSTGMSVPALNQCLPKSEQRLEEALQLNGTDNIADAPIGQS